jgi:hypothetical protein
MSDDRTTLYLRGVPRQLVREAKAEAARRGSTLAAVVSEALEHQIHAGGTDAAGGAAAGLDASMRWYRAHRARLVDQYAGQYIAIIDQSVVDHDVDFERLAERVFATRPQRAVYMPFVASQDRVARVRSPRRKR